MTSHSRRERIFPYIVPSQEHGSSQKLIFHSLKPQDQLVGSRMSCVRIDLLYTLIIDNVRPVIRIDRSRYQFHLCSNAIVSILSYPSVRSPSSTLLPKEGEHTLHSEITPNAHPAPAPKRPEPAAHLPSLRLARIEPALGLPGFRVREYVRAAVERVRLRADAYARG